jgi:hypothetical protein
MSISEEDAMQRQFIESMLAVASCISRHLLLTDRNFKKKKTFQLLDATLAQQYLEGASIFTRIKIPLQLRSQGVNLLSR